jgi:hypothetical protein
MMISGDTEVAVPESRDHGDMHSSEPVAPSKLRAGPRYENRTAQLKLTTLSRFRWLGWEVFEHAVDVVVHGFGIFVFVAGQIFGCEASPEQIFRSAFE